jgi:glutaredoxin
MYTIYTKDNCPFCDKAKNLLNQKGIQFNTIKLGTDITREQLLEKIPSARTMPQIMMGETLIGGYKELESSLAS